MQECPEGQLIIAGRNPASVLTEACKHQKNITIIPNPENKSEVDHIDSNPANNDVTNLRWVNHEEQYRNEETIKKKQLGQERQQRRWKIKPLLDKIFEIEPDKIELIKMIIEYKS